MIGKGKRDDYRCQREELLRDARSSQGSRKRMQPLLLKLLIRRRSERYCAVNLWNMAVRVDAICNELGLTIPVAIHADHYGIKSEKRSNGKSGDPFLYLMQGSLPSP
jgi:fructose-bisphosphate aldolase class II